MPTSRPKDREPVPVEGELVVKPKFASERLDHFLVHHQIHSSRTQLQRWIRDGEIRVNDHAVKPNYKVHPGDRILYRIPRPQPLDIRPEPIPLDVLYEDSDIIVINKPVGLVVHPAPGHYTGTLIHALLAHANDLSGIGGRTRPGLVHRLDKDTSGVMVVAKTDGSHQKLAQQFKSHTIHRRYQAIVVGRPPARTGKIELAIGRDRWDRKKISSRTTKPRAALTIYRVLETFRSAALVEVLPQTGRTHQIRVHFASLRCPILGDRVYGGRGAVIEDVTVHRQMLHAERLGFLHPTRNRPIEFSAPLPADMESVLELLRSARSTRPLT